MKRTERCLGALLFSSAALTSSLACAGQAAFDPVCEREMRAASQAESVPLGILYAVGLTETGRGKKLHPYALNVAGKSIFATSKSDALKHFHSAQKNGKKLIDIGCMQINHHYHAKEFSSLDQMFDPKSNVMYAAKFLKRLKHRQGSWTMAVARYHAGPNNNPAQKRYVCAVIGNLVASGFGKWTNSSRTFCK